METRKFFSLLLFCLLCLPREIHSQSGSASSQWDAGVLSGMGARNIGSATMSGRISAIAAYNQDGKTIIFAGAASGGVWKSPDGGTTFKPVFDDQPVQSIGAITIDPSRPRTVWVGTGEAWTRNSVSIGDGIYKSADGGETWKHLGLAESERITKIVVHPKNSDVVYACVPGKLWSDSAERGLYKTIDGGQNWTLVLKGKNLSTGCSAVSLDPQNPDHLFAGLWDFRRQGWTFRSGGDGPLAFSGSGLYQSRDGGHSWTELTEISHQGIPPKPWGRVEVEIAPSDPKRIYVFIESANSALYVSEDGGQSWQTRDKSQMMVWRPFYFANLIVDPTNADRVFKTNLRMVVSDDGGRSFSDAAGATHSDSHDLWINPDNSKHMVMGDDGGLWYSYDGGSRWWKGENLPISQFYHVAVDGRDPYQVYGGLQDNSSFVGDSFYPGGISNDRWENLYGGDGFWVVPDPRNPDIVYAESQGGFIGRIDRRTRLARSIQPKAGYGEKLRFNWNTPIYISPSEKDTLYLGSQFLFRSRDRGNTWERISPDLTTNDPEKQKQEQSGGVTVDNSSAETHCTLYSISESPLNSQIIWAGTDDGNLQVTRDGGKTWSNRAANVPGLPPHSWVSWVESSRYNEASAYAAFDRHPFGDMDPYLYKTSDFGQTWIRIAAPGQGIRGYAHVIKEDPVKSSLLFLGTEFGLWISPDVGSHWAEFRGGHFPAVAVCDIALQPRENDLVLGTHGRGIWIIDDLTPLRELSEDLRAQEAAFLPVRSVQQRMSAVGGWMEGDAKFSGTNPPGGAVITYYQRARHLFGPLRLEILDAQGKTVDTLPASKRRGINRVVWSMRVNPPRIPRAASVAFNSAQGPRVVPGTYTVRLTKGSRVWESKLEIGLDRRADYSLADRQAQFDAAMRVHSLFGKMSDLVDQINQIREASENRIIRLTGEVELKKPLEDFSLHADEIRKKIVATKEGGAITGEERLREFADDLYGSILSYEGRPPAYLLDRAGVLEKMLEDYKSEFELLLKQGLPAFNQKLEKQKLPRLALFTRDPRQEDSPLSSADLEVAFGTFLGIRVNRVRFEERD